MRLNRAKKNPGIYSYLYLKIIITSVILLNSSGFAQAWVYSEHRDIAIQAVQNLDAEHMADFNRFWQSSRVGFEERLCESAADATQGLKTNCLDWVAFSAIAGDHSCSGKEMLNSILTEKWLLNIANISAELKVALALVPVDEFEQNNNDSPDMTKSIMVQISIQENRAKRLNALRIADNKILKADPDYANRASSNTAHFLIARPSSEISSLDYGKLAVRSGSDINAVGVYAWYHISALKKASRLANEPMLSVEQRQTITRSMLADEGFALHFLEDSFAAGHVAGTWGEVSQRLGTHNYYNQHGLETYTWERTEYPVVLMGDAHMRQQDMEFASEAISASIRQVLDFAVGRETGYAQPYVPTASAEADDFNVCLENQFPLLDNGSQYVRVVTQTVMKTPIPGLGVELGALPRFRSEVGSFVGLSGSTDIRMVDGGFLNFQDKIGSIGGLDLSFRAGFGMEGIMGDAGDGLVFASIGFHSDSASTNKFNDSPELNQVGELSAAIPARSALSGRIRMPFYLIPADLLLLSPLFLINEAAYINMAVTAGNGGLIPWQQGIATSIGRFQFVAGRELGVIFYGWTSSDQLIVPADSVTDDLRLHNIKSILFDLPIVEYRPYRSFSSNQSSSVLFQLFAGADVPFNSKPIVVDGVSYSLKTIWSLGLRLVFDWRHY